MDTNWAKKQMKKGKKVRRDWWEENEYIYLDGDTCLDNDGWVYHFEFAEYEDAEDWELYKD